MPEKTNLFFDLDGTLTDSGEGILNSVKYALKYFGIEETDNAKLRRFLGPPLGESFIDFYGFSEADARTAVAKYREYFVPKGIYENHPYDGIEEMLTRLKSAGKNLYIASAKPTVFCEKVVEFFHFEKYFTFVQGAELTDIDISKEKILSRMLKRFNIPPDTAVMTGDRIFDINAAVKNGVVAVAAAYGYGKEDEFEKADRRAANVRELEKILLEL